ncbi:MAG: TIGR03016 family PEP-CTERM system-associated outer membrane protein [Burkholderiaceae bacterium]
MRPVAAACLAVAGLIAAGTPALAQEDSAAAAASGSGRSGFSVSPRISVSETWTDNLRLTGDGYQDRALVTSVTPGVSVSSRSGVFRGTLDYSLDAIVYTKSDSKNRVQNQMNGRGTAELVPQALFVDVIGNISQQSISAFGTQSPSNELDNANRTETRQLQVSPYWRGLLLGSATFELRASGTIRDNSETTGGNGNTKEGTLSFSLSGPQGRALNWGLQANTTRQHYEQTGLDYRSSMGLGSLTWVPDVDVQLGVNGGVERNDYLGAETTTIYGVSGKWTPTPRTSLSADWQHHNYGASHNFRFEHRMARFVVRAVSTQSVNTGASPDGQLNNYGLLDLQFSALEPDPVKRDILVRTTLAALGLKPDGISNAGFLANTAMLQRRSEVSMAWSGQRLTVTLGLNDNNSRALGVAPSGSGDLSLSDNVRQRGATVSVAYRLTPTASSTLTANRQHSAGDGGLGGDTTSLYFTTTVRLGARTDASLGLRHTRSDDQFLAYRENAVFATLTQRF